MVDPREDLLEAVVVCLRARKNTQNLADRVEAELRSLQRAERWMAQWDPQDRQEVLHDLATDGAARLRSRRQGAKPPSHLADLRGQWNQLTRSIQSAFATAPAGGPERPVYIRDALQTMWYEFLGQSAAPKPSTLDYALDAKKVRNIAFRLLQKANGWADPENVRRSLRRG